MMASEKPDPSATERTRTRYQHLSPYYDRMEGIAERRYHPWRERLWSLVIGPKVLEVGVATGKNMSYYPEGLQVTAIDLTPGMLERARKLSTSLGLSIDLRLGDVQALDFADTSFDAAISAFVFCSVSDPILGLGDIARVANPVGQVLLLEHLPSANQAIGILMDFLNPLVVRIMGANINRRTVGNVQKSGLIIERVEDLGMGGIFKLIVARPPKYPP